jgi:L-asparaginase II
VPGSRSARGAPPVLVEVLRGGRVESRHRGSIAVCAPSGELLVSAGDPDAFVYVRSTAKPFQLAPFVASGLFDRFELGTDALAVMAASHSGEDRHVRTVQAILRAGGLSTGALACGSHAPYDSETARRLIRDGEQPTVMRHNCSGKHAGMLLFAKASGWPTDGYWQPDHPVQQACLAAVAVAAGIDPDRIATAVDGCGVVTFGMPLRALATAFARLVDPSPLPDESLRMAVARIAAAMMGHPELVAGERRRLDTALMRALRGRLVSKGGAEGVQGLALMAGAPSLGPAAGVALVIEDGNAGRRAGNVASCEALRQLELLDHDTLERLAEFAAPAVLDPRGEESGEVRAAFRLR